METIHTLKTIRTPRFVVTLEAHPEYEIPADTIAWDDLDAEAEYVRKIESGDIPWYCLGAHVYVNSGGSWQGREIGSSYLGCVDTEDFYSVGARDVVAMAIEDARGTIAKIS